MIYFSLEPDLNWFYTFLSDQLGREVVERRDLRLATRHDWELDKQAEKLTFKLLKPMREVYWTRYPKTDVERSKGVFLCSDPGQGRGCGKLFIQEVTSKGRLCPQCS